MLSFSTTKRYNSLTLIVLMAVLGIFTFFKTPVHAFVPAPVRQQLALNSRNVVSLNERRWNFNDGQSPFGLKKNAEIWNGRVAQVGFVVAFVQELVQGKGCIESVQEGDPLSLALLGIGLVSVVGLTAFLALKGDDDYVSKALNNSK